MSTLYFAYGSNCLASQMAQRSPNARLVGKAELDSHRFAWLRRKNRGIVATYGEANEGTKLHGVLYEGADREALDHYEGAGYAYERRSVTVDTLDGPRDAYTYVAIERQHDKRGAPTDSDGEYVYSVSYGRASHGYDTDNAHFVLVYGTLMMDLSNHHVLKSGRLSEYVGRVEVDGYDMVSLGGFPGIVSGWSTITAEGYIVDDRAVRAMDRLEGHPTFYKRQRVITKRGHTAWIYVLQRTPSDRDTRARIFSGDWRKHVLEHNQPWRKS